MDSYNCFYSALCYMLEQFYPGISKMLINNRWQFFYKQSDDYSDDQRIIGEFPMLYDEHHLKFLQEKFGIQVSFIKEHNISIESFKQSVSASPTMLFVNKIIFINNLPNPMRRCVTTIISERSKESMLFCHTFDKDLDSIQMIDTEALYYSWVCASDYEQLNQCNISVKFPLKHITKLSLHNFSKECMRTSLSNYLSKENSGSISYGYNGMKKFSEDILDWDVDNFQKLIDCAMYMDIIIQQRMFFISTLKELSLQNRKSILRILEMLIEDWNRLKMSLYIIGMRKQSDARKQLSEWISKLGDFEFNAVFIMLEALR